MSADPSSKAEKNLEDALTEARRIIGEIKYGSVTLVIQDGVVVQIERQEKVRLK